MEARQELLASVEALQFAHTEHELDLVAGPAMTDANVNPLALPNFGEGQVGVLTRSSLTANSASRSLNLAIPSATFWHIERRGGILAGTTEVQVDIN